jgi:glutathione S-transferase
MKLLYSPGACSLGIHVILEEIGKPFAAERFSTRDGGTYTPEFIAMNPKSKVPTLLRDDGSVLTEYPAIAYYLAATNPEAKLLPADPAMAARALELTDFAVATMHMQGFSRIFRPANFAPSEADHEAVKARGREIYEKGLAVMDRALEGQDYLCGEFSIADSALFYVCFWWAARLGHALPANVAAHYDRMKARPAVARTMAAEGLA